MVTWTHDDLASDLAAHVRVSGNWMTWEDMQLGDSGSIRPDVYAIEKTYQCVRAVVYECKVTKADFRSDVTSGKWQGYLKYATSVTFAVPAGLVTKDDVPAACGLIVRHDAVWRHARKPVYQRMPELPYMTWLKLLMDGVDRQGEAGRNQHFNEYLAQKRLAAKFGGEVGKLLSDIQGLPAVYEYRRSDMERQLQNLQAQVDAAQHQYQERERSNLNRLGENVVDLAVSLGVPRDASLGDLATAVHRITQVLTSRRGAVHRLVEMAGELQQAAAGLEALTKQVRDERPGIHGPGCPLELRDLSPPGLVPMAGGAASPEEWDRCGAEGGQLGCDTTLCRTPPACGGDSLPRHEGVATDLQDL